MIGRAQGILLVHTDRHGRDVTCGDARQRPRAPSRGLSRRDYQARPAAPSRPSYLRRVGEFRGAGSWKVMARDSPPREKAALPRATLLRGITPARRECCTVDDLHSLLTAEIADRSKRSRVMSSGASRSFGAIRNRKPDHHAGGMFQVNIPRIQARCLFSRFETCC